jgi:hypothetical protein
MLGGDGAWRPLPLGGQRPRAAPWSGPGGPVARQPGGRFGRGPRPVWEAARGPRPSRPRLFSCDPESARSHRGQPPRQSPAGWPALASCGGVAHGHTDGGPGCPGRRPRRRHLARRPPRPWQPGARPCRGRVCETAPGLPSERVGGMVRPQVVRRERKRTRMPSGGNGPFSEVIMSRHYQTPYPLLLHHLYGEYQS